MLKILVFYKSLPITNYFLIATCITYCIVRVGIGLKKKTPISQSEILGFSLILLLIFVVAVQNIVTDDFSGFDGVNVTNNITALTVTSIVWFFVGAGCSQFEFRESAIVSVLVGFIVLVSMSTAIDETLTIPYLSLIHI